MAGGLFSNGAGPSTIDVSAFFDSDLPVLIAETVAMGVLVSVGTTRDRGALSLTVTADGAFDREYFRTSEDACDYLRRAGASLRSLGYGSPVADPPTKPLATRRRQKLT